MISDIKKNPVKVLIDTNVLLSALGFGGIPRQILLLVIQRKIKAIISPILMAEIHEVVSKKFPLIADKLPIIEKKIKKLFTIVHPKRSLKVVRDIDDNRVLEAALEEKCKYVITGDSDLLELKNYKDITIVTPREFLEKFEKKYNR